MVLSDINMPQMDGLTLLQQIPKVDPDLRAVIISAYGDMKNIRTAMNRGAFDFVTKPIDFEDLEVTIERTLSNIAEWRDALLSRDKLVVLQNELDVASSMQQSILPTQFPKGPSYEVFGSMKPARSVGGDFFDIMRLENGKIGVAIADVSGKGVIACPLHDVHPYPAKRRGHRHLRPRRGVTRGQQLAQRGQRSRDVRDHSVRGVRSGERGVDLC